MAKKKKNNEQRNQTLAIYALVALGLAVITLAIFTQLNKMSLTRDVSDRVTEARTNDAPRRDAERIERIDKLYDARLITSKKPTFSSKTDVCYLGHNGQGLFNASYYQDCYIRFVDGFEVDSDRATVEQQAMNYPSLDLGDLSLQATNSDGSQCGKLFSAGGETTVLYLDGTQTVDGTHECVVPDPIRGVGSMEGVDVDNGRIATYSARTFKARDVRLDKKYIVLQKEVHYTDKIDLGCSLWPLCTPPLDQAVIGDR